MKDFSVLLLCFVLLAVAVRYIYQIWKHEISPTLSTWIIFSLGTGLSLTTYLIAEEYDFRSGILNTLDAVGTVTIVLAIIICGKHEVHFKSFEKWYLRGIGAIIIYGLLSGDAWTSNIFAQVLISVGYFPTIQSLLTEKKNTESFTAWGLNALAGLISFYPAIMGGKILAVLYSARSTVCIFVLLTIMIFLELRSRRKSQQT